MSIHTSTEVTLSGGAVSRIRQCRDSARFISSTISNAGGSSSHTAICLSKSSLVVGPHNISSHTTTITCGRRHFAARHNRTAISPSEECFYLPSSHSSIPNHRNAVVSRIGRSVGQSVSQSAQLAAEQTPQSTVQLTARGTCSVEFGRCLRR